MRTGCERKMKLVKITSREPSADQQRLWDSRLQRFTVIESDLILQINIKLSDPDEEGKKQKVQTVIQRPRNHQAKGRICLDHNLELRNTVNWN